MAGKYMSKQYKLNFVLFYNNFIFIFNILTLYRLKVDTFCVISFATFIAHKTAIPAVFHSAVIVSPVVSFLLAL